MVKSNDCEIIIKIYSEKKNETRNENKNWEIFDWNFFQTRSAFLFFFEVQAPYVMPVITKKI